MLLISRIRTIKSALKKSRMVIILIRSNKEYPLAKDLILLFVPLVHLSFKKIRMIRILILDSISIQIAFRKNSKSLTTFSIPFLVFHLECPLQALSNQTCQYSQSISSAFQIEIHLEVNSSLSKLKKGIKTDRTAISLLKNKKTTISKTSETKYLILSY